MNLFETVAGKIKNSYVMLWIFAASVIMLIIGGNHFIEDTLSSRFGLEQLSLVYSLKPVFSDFTWWTMSLAPQIAQIVFAYILISNPQRGIKQYLAKNWWALVALALSFGVDFFSDSWYRSSQGLFDSPGKFLISISFTFVYYTIGSELFITIGFGMVAELFAPFISQLSRLKNSVVVAFANRKLNTGNNRPSYSQVMQPPAFHDKKGRKRAYVPHDLFSMVNSIRDASPERRNQMLNGIRSPEIRGKVARMLRDEEEI